VPRAAAAVAGPASYTPAHLAARILTSREALEGERKLVTVLLADLKGSMELLADRDPEEARGLLDPVLQHMMEAVHHYEGTVNQVMGDGIMALFGAPLAHEDHALRACYAALRMQERVGRYSDEIQRTQGVPVQIRVGLNSGEVVVRSIGSDLHMDYSAVGQTTHLAARMEQMARPGSVLLTIATHQLVEGYVRIRPLGPLPVKGLGHPVEVFELLGAAPTRTRLQVAATRGLTRFVGRDAELEQLRTSLARAGGGRGQVVALVGEPGVGKSRLVWELAHSHRTDGWLVVESSSASYGKATTFAPVIHLLRTYFGLEDYDDARRAREKLTGRLLTLDEQLRPVLPALQGMLDIVVDDSTWRSLPPDRQRQQVVDGVKRVLLRESQVQPLLVVVEDLHWVDASTQGLLDSLVESLPSHRVLLLVNYRPEYRHGWGGKSYYTQIRLDPLPPASVETLLDGLLGSDAGLRPLLSLLTERAQGNPFFLEESVRALVETGVLTGERGAYRLAKPVDVVQVPATVRVILAARIDRLTAGDKALLEAASVVGKDVPLAVLQAVADLTDEEVAAGLGRLQAAEFFHEARLFPQVEYTFKHSLTHEVAYSTLLHERRRSLHARAVEAIERLYPHALAEHRHRLVHHAFRGEVWSKALAHLRDLNEIPSDTAIGEVMGVGPESPGRLWWAGEHERARRAAERDLAVAASFGNFGLRIVSGCRVGQAHHALGDYARATEVLRQVVASLPDDLARERFGMAGFASVFARSYLAWSLAEQGEFTEGVPVGVRGMEIAEDDPYSLGQAAYGLGMVHVLQGRHERAIQLLERALVVARLGDIPFMFPFLVGLLGAARALGDDPVGGVPLLEQAVEQGASMKLRAHHALRLIWLGHGYLLTGRYEAARDVAHRAVLLAEECQERGQHARALCLAADIAASGEEPDVAVAEAAYGRAEAMAATLGMRPLVANCRLGRGRLHRRTGDHALAREHLAAAAALFETVDMLRGLAAARVELAAAG
jgi:class 3 adenylate cyclase/tetratricopeptide (TPR) repeat protein